MFATNRHLDYSRCIAHNCWLSVNTHFQNKAVTILSSLLPIKATNTLVIHNSEKFTFQLSTCNTETHWHSIHPQVDLLPIHNLAPSIVIVIINSTYWLPLWPCQTWPLAKLSPLIFFHWSLTFYKNLYILWNDSFWALHFCFITNI